MTSMGMSMNLHAAYVYVWLLIIEYKRPNLNTLPARLILLIRVREGGMRHSLRTPVIQRVEALDQCHFLGSLAVLEVPAMVRIGLDAVGLASAIRVDQCGSYKIGIRDRVCICDSKRVFVDRADGPPNLYYRQKQRLTKIFQV